jgi:hypothetical protein
MTNLPPEIPIFTSLVDAQPEPVRAALHYCLALVMVETGVARLVETLPGDTAPICVFETVTGETFCLAKAAIGRQEEEELIATLRQLFDEEGER